MRRNVWGESPTDARPSSVKLTVAEWWALPVSARAADKLGDIMILLVMLRDDISSSAEGRCFSWMDGPIEQTLKTVDNLMRKLAV